MRSHSLIITPDVITDILFSLGDILVTAFGHPLCLKASKEAFSGGIVPAIAFSAHTLLHLCTLYY